VRFYGWGNLTLYLIAPLSPRERFVGVLESAYGVFRDLGVVVELQETGLDLDLILSALDDIL